MPYSLSICLAYVGVGNLVQLGMSHASPGKYLIRSKLAHGNMFTEGRS